MRILLTNDDGIEAIGLRYLAAWARHLGEVTVVAPKVEQSGASHGIVLRRAFEVRPSTALADLGLEAWYVDSTPADCVRYAFDKLGTFDLVISGINHGFNIGHDISYSATCAAAFEAVFGGAKALAISSDLGALETARDHLPAIEHFIEGHQLLAHGSLYNINVPHHPKGIRLTQQGGTFYSDHFEEVAPHHYKARGYIAHVHDPKDMHLDTNAITAGYISISPLTTGRTDHEAWARLHH